MRLLAALEEEVVSLCTFCWFLETPGVVNLLLVMPEEIQTCESLSYDHFQTLFLKSKIHRRHIRPGLPTPRRSPLSILLAIYFLESV